MSAPRTFGPAVEATILAYRRSLLFANAGAVDTERDVISQGKGGHGKHGATTVAPTHGADLPLAVRIERLQSRVATIVERWLAEEEERATGRPCHDRRSSAKQAETRAILAAVGQDPTEVAYLYGRTTEAVRKLRQRSGLDPDTGERVRRDVLTAPADDQLHHHESATTTEDQ